MKILLAFSFTLIVFQTYSQAPIEQGNWELTFSDDFDRLHLEQEKWHHGGAALYTNGMAANTGEQIFTEDGFLKMIAERRPAIFGGKAYEYESSEISTFPVFRQAYGYFEARIRYEAKQGVWPAFWLMPDNGARGPSEQQFESFLQFEIDTTTEIVESAVLRLKVKSKSASSTCNVTVHELLTDEWDEHSLTWSNKPGYDPIYIRQLTGTSDPDLTNELVVGEYVEINVTKAVNHAILNNYYPGFALIDKFMRSIQIEFYSKESVSENDWPQLVLSSGTYHPSDDACVRGGSYADVNFGDEATLLVKEPWVSNSSTYDEGMEVDILESLGIWGEDMNQHAMHWDGYGDDHQTAGLAKYKIPATNDGFHTYGLYWKPGVLEFYVDGTQTWCWENPRVATVPSFMILTHQIGGWDGNAAVLDDLLPATMEVDYVRVYKNLDGAKVVFKEMGDSILLAEGSEFLLQTEVFEYGGKISQVAFYRDDTLQSVDALYPYNINLNNLRRGTYTFVAEGLNPEDKVLSRDTLKLLVADQPSIQILSPQTGKEFDAPLDLLITAEAGSSSGQISSVELYINGSLITEDKEVPYTFDLADVIPGIYQIQCVAVDDLGLRTFSEIIEIKVNGGALSLPWQKEDVGAQTQGRGSQYDERLILEGSGTDFLGEVDQFTFVHQSLSGDGDLIAMIGSFDEANEWSRAGIMMRDNLESGAICAAMTLKPESGSAFSFRRKTDVMASNLLSNDYIDPPYWFRINRTANVFTGYKSVDGKQWEQCFNPVPIEMKERIFVGLVLSAVSEDKRAQAVFEGVTILGNTYANHFPELQLISPSSDTTLDQSNSLLVKINASDPDGGRIDRIDFIIDSVLCSTAYEEPYNYDWISIGEGLHSLWVKATDDEGSISVSDTLFIDQRKINAIGNSSGHEIKIILSPMPVSKMLTIELTSQIFVYPADIKIFNMQGEIIYESKIEGFISQIALDGICSGIYILNIESQGANISRRIVIVNE